jgi:uncharacterized protein YjbI with pentapeptide repeats
MPSLSLRSLSAAVALVTLAALAGIRPAQATEDDGNAAAPDYINGCGIWPHTRCPGADLRGADLSARNLAGADLRGAKLAGADLRVANLAGANLDGANLAGARLNKINAPTATFRGANFSGADLEFARVMRCDFSDADFTGANLEMVRAAFSWFVRAKLVDANLQEGKFNTVNFTGATMKGNVLRFTIFPDSTFDQCTGCPTDW